MVDFHTHILPFIDDGSDSIETSVAMLNALKNDGVTDVVFSPHFYWSNLSAENMLAERSASYEKLKQHIPSGLNVHLAAEVEFSEIPINYSALKVFAIDGGKYILLELPYGKMRIESIYENLKRFKYTTGAIPIIAHTERYFEICRNPEIITHLIDLGCLIQVNCSSVIEAERGSLVYTMLQHGMVHLLGTDTHNMTSRPPCFASATDKILSQFGQECLDYIKTISKDVIDGKKVGVSTNYTIKRHFNKYR